MINVSKELKYDSKKLKESYEETIKDENFKNFVSKLKLSDDTLMRYTSFLKDSYHEFEHCLNCDGLANCQNKLLGYAYLPKIINGNLQFDYKPCRFKIKQDNKFSYLKNVKYYNLPNSYKEASWEKVNKRIPSRLDVIKYLASFINGEVSKGIYLSGSFGCGKTYLIVATFNKLALNNIKSAIIFWPEFLRDLKTSFDTDYALKMEYIKNVPLLLIDDIGAELATSWGRDEILCPILQHRMDNNLATFMTSNLNLDELASHLSQTKDGVEIVKASRIIERIKYLMVEYKLEGKSLR